MENCDTLALGIQHFHVVNTFHSGVPTAFAVARMFDTGRRLIIPNMSQLAEEGSVLYYSSFNLFRLKINPGDLTKLT